MAKKKQVYRSIREIWGEERTVLVFISENLKSGQIRGIYQSLNKKIKKLQELRNKLSNSRKKQNKLQLEKRLEKLTQDKFNLLQWSLTEKSEGKFILDFSINQEYLEEIEEKLGLRIFYDRQAHLEKQQILLELSTA